MMEQAFSKKELFDLAYEFKRTKIWNRIYENDLFAVKLGDEIAYCSIMGLQGEHIALGMYIGDIGFTSYRRIATRMGNNLNDLLEQECVQCALDEEEDMTEEEIEEACSYLKSIGKRMLFPAAHFMRFDRYCMPCGIKKSSDWEAIATGLRVVLKISSMRKEKLGIRGIVVRMFEEHYIEEEIKAIRGEPLTPVKIPLFTLVDDELKSEMIPLPQAAELLPPKPEILDELAMARLMKHRQEGTLECEVIRAWEPIDGDPPFLPAILVTVKQNGNVLPPIVAEKIHYDPSSMLQEFVTNLGDLYPRRIKIRTQETSILLEEFCRLTHIDLVVTQDLDQLDKFVEALREDSESMKEDPAELLAMLEEMPLEALREMPQDLVEQILKLPEDVAPNLRKKLQMLRNQ